MTSLIVRMPLSGSAPVVYENKELAHGTHLLEPAFWKTSLEKVYSDNEVRHCFHRSDAALRKRSLEQ
eukprot:6216428-Amphidinium_carterae.2